MLYLCYNAIYNIISYNINYIKGLFMDFVNTVITSTLTNVEDNLKIDEELIVIERSYFDKKKSEQHNDVINNEVINNDNNKKTNPLEGMTAKYMKSSDIFYKCTLLYPMVSSLLILVFMFISIFNKTVSEMYEKSQHFLFDQMTINAYLTVLFGIFISSAIVSFSFWAYQSVILVRDFKTSYLSLKIFKGIALTFHFWRFYAIFYTMLYVVHHFSNHG